MRATVTLSTLALATLAVGTLALTAGSVSARAAGFPEPGQACHVPVCSAREAINDFADRDMPERLLEIRRLERAYPAATATPAALANLTEFLRLLLAIPSTGQSLEGEWRREARLYRAATLEAALLRTTLSSEIELPVLLGAFYPELPSLAAKLAVTERWENLAESFSDRERLSRTVTVLASFRWASERQGDPRELRNRLRNAELRAAARLNRLFPPPPIRDPEDGNAGELDPACGLPVCDVNAELERFRALPSGSRYLQSQALRLAWQENTDPRILTNLLELGRGLTRLFRNLGEQPWTVAMAEGIRADALMGLLKTAPVREGEKSARYFQELQGEALRYEALRHWRTLIPAQLEEAPLKSILKFFELCLADSERAGDPDYLPREARIALEEAQARLLELFPPPPPVETCMQEICNEATELQRIRAMGQASRFQWLRRLAERARVSTDQAWLLQATRLSREAGRIFTEVREEDWVIREAASTRSTAYFSLLRNAEPRATLLSEYYAGMSGETFRYQILGYWRSRVQLTSDLDVLGALKEFFRQSAQRSIQEGDPEYVSREASMGVSDVDDRVTRLTQGS